MSVPFGNSATLFSAPYYAVVLFLLLPIYYDIFPKYSSTTFGTNGEAPDPDTASYNTSTT